MKIPGRQYTIEERATYVPTLRTRAHYYGRVKRMSLEDVEDFGSFAVISYLETGRHDLEWLYVDWRRETSGRRDSKNYEARLLMNNADELDPTHEGDPNDLLVEFEARDVMALLKLVVNPQWREVLRLWVEGLNQAEIGRLMEISESRVSQIVKFAVYDIRRKLKSRERADLVEYSENNDETPNLQT